MNNDYKIKHFNNCISLYNYYISQIEFFKFKQKEIDNQLKNCKDIYFIFKDKPNILCYLNSIKKINNNTTYNYELNFKSKDSKYTNIIIGIESLNELLFVREDGSYIYG